MTKFTCTNCVHAGEPHTFGDCLVVECRQAPPSPTGFPIVSAHSWCTPGRNDTANNKTVYEEPKPVDDKRDYVIYNNGDGTVLTLHVPTVIAQLYKRVDELERELDILERRS